MLILIVITSSRNHSRYASFRSCAVYLTYVHTKCASFSKNALIWLETVFWRPTYTYIDTKYTIDFSYVLFSNYIHNTRYYLLSILLLFLCINARGGRTKRNTDDNATSVARGRAAGTRFVDNCQRALLPRATFIRWQHNDFVVFPPTPPH